MMLESYHQKLPIKASASVHACLGQVLRLNYLSSVHFDLLYVYAMGAISMLVLHVRRDSERDVIIEQPHNSNLR